MRSRVNDAAQILGLTDYLGRYPRQLSGGQRQRVAMGRAIVRKPQVFLFDEPLSNLDAKLRVAMRTEIKALHQRLATTSIYVTHDQIEAMTMADRIVVMNAGRVEQIGSPLQLYDDPANRFVAGFIGSPAMNFLAARVAAANGSAVTLELDGGVRLPAPPAATALHPGRELILGLRPEHLLPAGDGLPAVVKVIEPTGADTQLLCGVAGHDITVLLRERRDLRVGDALHLAPQRCYLFDADNGDRVA